MGDTGVGHGLQSVRVREGAPVPVSEDRPEDGGSRSDVTLFEKISLERPSETARRKDPRQRRRDHGHPVSGFRKP